MTNPNEIEAAVLRVIETYADSYTTMSKIGEGRVYCTSVAYDLRRNIADGIKEVFAASARGVADGWQPIETMPSGKWVFVYVPGVSGSGVEAIKKPDVSGAFWAGRIISLQTGREIVRATHWRPAMRPPQGWPLSDNSLYAAPSSPAATPEVEREAIEANAKIVGEVANLSGCLMTPIVARRIAAAIFRTPPAPAGEECLRMIASMIPRTSAQAYWFHVAADIVGLPHIEMEQDIPAENDVERVAEAIRDIKGGLNYDYMDFCRDAARAAIAAMPESFTTGFNAGRDAAAGVAEEIGRAWHRKAQSYRKAGNNGPYLGEPSGFSIATAIRAIEAPN